MSSRASLAAHSTIVADTGDLDSIRQLQSVGATTNPSLILAAVNDPKFSDLVETAIKNAKGNTLDEKVTDACERLAVAFGSEITKIVSGYVSTEVNAGVSFDVNATIAKAQKIISLYEELGVSKDRILIKIAATWEGVKAAEILEKQGIACNMTLLFNFHQAVACAHAKVRLISPYVGRILDYYKAKEGRDFEPEEDPGVLSVRKIFNYYKKHGHETIVMGASFRSVGQLLALAGIDRLTISPKLLNELDSMSDPVQPKLIASEAMTLDIPAVEMNEQIFRWEMNQDAMATEKLSEGIRKFAADLDKLEDIVRSKMALMMPQPKTEEVEAAIKEATESLGSGAEATAETGKPCFGKEADAVHDAAEGPVESANTVGANVEAGAQVEADAEKAKKIKEIITRMQNEAAPSNVETTSAF